MRNDYMKAPESFPEFDHHAHVETIRNPKGEVIGFVAIHRQNGSVPSFGATRLWHYDSPDEALCDALRLSRVMSYKAALAGLPCGGAKAALIRTGNSEEERGETLQAYASGIASLTGRFVTGTDVGLRQSDLAGMRSLGAPVIGFNGVSTPFSVFGVYQGIGCALRERLGDERIAGHTFAIQGLGKIGMGILEQVATDAAEIYVADIDDGRVQAALDRFPHVMPIAAEDIHRQSVDVLVPCALGSVITAENVPEMNCAVVAGGANDQLRTPEAGDALFARNILYAPDYVINAGGLIAVFDEYEHPDYDELRVRDKVSKIRGRLSDLFAESHAQKKAVNRVAQEKAEGIFEVYDSKRI